MILDTNANDLLLILKGLQVYFIHLKDFDSFTLKNFLEAAQEGCINAKKKKARPNNVPHLFETDKDALLSFNLLLKNYVISSFSDDQYAFNLELKSYNLQSVTEELYLHTTGSFSIDIFNDYCVEKGFMDEIDMLLLLVQLIINDYLEIYIMFRKMYFRFTKNIFESFLDVLELDSDLTLVTEMKGKSIAVSKKEAAYERGTELLELIQMLGYVVDVELFNTLAVNYNLSSELKDLEDAELLNRKPSLYRDKEIYTVSKFVLSKHLNHERSVEGLEPIKRKSIGKIDISSKKEQSSTFKLWILLNDDRYLKYSSTLRNLLDFLKSDVCSNLFCKDIKTVNYACSISTNQNESTKLFIQKTIEIEEQQKYNLSCNKIYREYKDSNDPEKIKEYQQMIAKKNSRINNSSNKSVKSQIENSTLTSARQRNLFISDIAVIHDNNHVYIKWAQYINTQNMSVDTFARKVSVNCRIAMSISEGLKLGCSYDYCTVYVPAHDYEIYKAVLDKACISDSNSAKISEYARIEIADF